MSSKAKNPFAQPDIRPLSQRQGYLLRVRSRSILLHAGDPRNMKTSQSERASDFGGAQLSIIKARRLSSHGVREEEESPFSRSFFLSFCFASVFSDLLSFAFFPSDMATTVVEAPAVEVPLAEPAPAEEAKKKAEKPVKERKLRVPKETKPKQPKAASHPPYFQMIKEALTSLNEKSGSSPYAIAKYMEEKHKAVLPANFKKILALQLKNSVVRGKLIKIKASYKLSEAGKKEKRKTGKVSKASTEKRPAKMTSRRETRASKKSEKAKKTTTPAKKKSKKSTSVKPKQPKSIKSTAAKKAKKATA